MNGTVLVVDDEAAARYGMRRALETESFTVLDAATLADAERLVASACPDAVILDLKLNQESGLDWLPTLAASENPPPVIVVTAYGSERLAVEAMKRGAFDYLAKPFDIDELRVLARNAVELSRLRSENRKLKRELAQTSSLGAIIGSSPAIKKVYSLIEKVGPTEVSILITGESGTGKELAAREIHRLSGRSGAFVPVNCAAIPSDLIESELFGHEKGAFTGAVTRRIGKIEAADNGTLFLDEVGDMSLPTQAKLLRALEEKSFERLGSNETLKSDIRILSATNKRLAKEEIPSGKFREDLFYRLSVVSMEMPPLRERKEDIPALVQSFSERLALVHSKGDVRISKPVYDLFYRYDWPGNVRQLRNCIERALVLSDTGEITLDVLPQELQGNESNLKTNSEISKNDFVIDAPPVVIEASSIPGSLKLKEAKKEFELRYIESVLEQTSGNITRAAGLLGIHRQSLQQKIKDLGLTKKFVLTE
jgi:DNA-binding NtrC family response regulator